MSIFHLPLDVSRFPPDSDDIYDGFVGRFLCNMFFEGVQKTHLNRLERSLYTLVCTLCSAPLRPHFVSLCDLLTNWLLIHIGRSIIIKAIILLMSFYINRIIEKRVLYIKNIYMYYISTNRLTT